MDWAQIAAIAFIIFVLSMFNVIKRWFKKKFGKKKEDEEEQIDNSSD